MNQARGESFGRLRLVTRAVLSAALLCTAPVAHAQPVPAAPSAQPGVSVASPAGEVRPPEVSRRVAAAYPDAARAAGTAGRVVLGVTVDARGSVADVEVRLSQGPLLDQAAIDAVRQWQFAPATRDGVALASKIEVPFDFVAAPLEQTPKAPPAVADPERVTVQGHVATRERSAGDFALQRDLIHAAPHHEGVDVLRAAPGLYIARPEGAAVAHRYMLRGFDSEHGQDIEFKVAGFPINIPSHLHGQGYADLGFLIAETVDELRVTEGVHDPRQGDFAVAGSIDVRLGVAERGISSRTSYGSFGTFRQLALWAPEDGARDSFAAFAHQSTDGFGENRRGAGTSAVLQQGFELDDWRLRVAGIFYAARAELAGVLRREDVEARTVGYYDVYPVATAKAQSALAGRALLGLFADYRGMAGESAELGLWLGYDRFRIQQNFTGFLERSQTLANVAGRGDLIEQRNRTFSLGGSARYHSPAYEPLELFECHLELGLSARLDEIDQTQNLLDAAVRSQTWDQRVDADILGLDLGTWADLDMHLSESLQLRLGVRATALSYEINDRLGNFATVVRPRDTYIVGFRRSAAGTTFGPRASIDFTPWRPLVLHASYGEGYRSPQARTLDEGERTPFTKVRSTDLGLRLRADRAFELNLAGYYTELSDDVAFDAGEGRLSRVGATRRLGAVLHGETRPLPGVVAAASVTYVDAELIEPPPATDEEPDPPFRRGQNLPYVPPLVVRVDIGGKTPLAAFERWGTLSGRAGLGASALSARPLPFGDFAEPLFVLDASVGLRLGALGLGMDVFNLLDAQYASLEYSFVSSWDPEAVASRLPARHLNAGAPRTLLFTLELEL